jgi:hypothetical protein
VVVYNTQARRVKREKLICRVPLKCVNVIHFSLRLRRICILYRQLDDAKQ